MQSVNTFRVTSVQNGELCRGVSCIKTGELPFPLPGEVPYPNRELSTQVTGLELLTALCALLGLLSCATGTCCSWVRQTQIALCLGAERTSQLKAEHRLHIVFFSSEKVIEKPKAGSSQMSHTTRTKTRM